MSGTKHILLAVLDWGLGHASRSTVIARSLLGAGARVSLAGAGPSLAFLRKELPDCPFHELPPYAMRWGRGGWAWQAIRQAPKVVRQFRAEHRWLRRYVAQNQVDGILSDCRFGFYHPQVPSVLITHQLQLPLSAPWSYPAQWVQQRIFRSFDELWVPDQPAPSALAGHLSAPLSGLKAQYLGNLSRFQATLSPSAKAEPTPQVGAYILILLSGPEPQRSLLENRIRQQFSTVAHPIILVRGLPFGKNEPRYEGPHLIYDYAFGEELAGLLACAKVVVCRSGYSTLMDLAALSKKALLIPTPGQLEQSYLAQYWGERDWAFAQKQQQLDLVDGIEQALCSVGPPMVDAAVEPVVKRWVLPGFRTCLASPDGRQA